MAKDEFIKEVCMHCINLNCDRRYIKQFRGKFGITQYRCNKYKNLFKCGQKDCNSCGKCK